MSGWVLAWTWLTTASAVAANEPSVSAKEILDRVDDLFRGESSTGRMAMTITTPNWTRTLDLEFWNKGKDRALIRILAPQKEKGTATLRVATDLWNFLPKVKRVIKLPSSMMSASWMGSHFSNDDLVKESRMAEDYTFETTFDQHVNGRRIVEITCHPKPQAAVVWGKIVVRVYVDKLLPIHSLYYDEDQHLARKMLFSDYKLFTDRELPAKVTVVPVDKPNESTVVFYKQIAFNKPVSDDTFSLRALQE